MAERVGRETIAANKEWDQHRVKKAAEAKTAVEVRNAQRLRRLQNRQRHKTRLGRIKKRSNSIREKCWLVDWPIRRRYSSRLRPKRLLSLHN